MTTYLERGNALRPGQFFYMRDPASAVKHHQYQDGHAVPTFVGGDIAGAVSVVPCEEATDGQAFVMSDSESGLGYDAIVRRNIHGGYDVLKPLTTKEMQ